MTLLYCLQPVKERHCFKDGSYDRYQSTTVVAPWPAAIAPKFKALGKAQEFPPGKPNAPPANSGTDTQSALFSNRGGSTPSGRNNTSYMRPDRDYTKHLTWTYEMNKNLYDIYNEAKQEGRGHMRRMKDIWDKTYPNTTT